MTIDAPAFTLCCTEALKFIVCPWTLFQVLEQKGIGPLVRPPAVMHQGAGIARRGHAVGRDGMAGHTALCGLYAYS